VAQLVAVILLAVVVMFAFRVVVVLLFLAGLIFRTQQTIGLLLILGAFALLRAYPAICLTLLAVLGVWAFVRNGLRNRDEPTNTDDAGS